jgi:hypothetical protein
MDALVATAVQLPSRVQQRTVQSRVKYGNDYTQTFRLFSVLAHFVSQVESCQSRYCILGEFLMPKYRSEAVPHLRGLEWREDIAT